VRKTLQRRRPGHPDGRDPQFLGELTRRLGGHSGTQHLERGDVLVEARHLHAGAAGDLGEGEAVEPELVDRLQRQRHHGIAVRPALGTGHLATERDQGGTDLLGLLGLRVVAGAFHERHARAAARRSTPLLPSDR
jgi:hypothetical protein